MKKIVLSAYPPLWLVTLALIVVIAVCAAGAGFAVSLLRAGSDPLTAVVGCGIIHIACKMGMAALTTWNHVLQERRVVVQS